MDSQEEIFNAIPSYMTGQASDTDGLVEELKALQQEELNNMLRGAVCMLRYPPADVTSKVTGKSRSC